MSRPLRIEYEGAWYHVMNRGTDRKVIFTKDEHRKYFLDLLRETVYIYQIEIHAYCLMDNHYHLLVHTPHANLSRAMRHLNGVYTQRFNRLEKRDGALFRGRYKAILIEKEAYLLQVSRYIHLNPVSASVCNTPENYIWSSYNNYIVQNVREAWITTKTIITEFSCIDGYIEYVTSGIDEETKNFYSKDQTPKIFSTLEFKKEKISAISVKEIDEILPDIKRLQFCPSIEIILRITADFFGINNVDLIKSQRGKKNIPKLIAIYLSRKLGLHTYDQIGKKFN
jgi:putative transposase